MSQRTLALDIDISIHKGDLLLVDVLELAKEIELRWWYICLHLNNYKLFKLSNNTKQ